MARYFMPLTCSAFDYFDHLVHVGAEAEVLCKFFEERLGFERAFGYSVPDATADATRLQLRGWLQSPTRRDSDVLLLYVATHGEVIDGQLYLHWHDSIRGDPRSALGITELAQVLGDSRVDRALIILDCCFAGAGLAPLADLVRDNPLRAIRTSPPRQDDAGIFILAGATRGQEGAQILLPNALIDAINDLGVSRSNHRYLTPGDISVRVNRDLDPFQRTLVASAGDGAGVPSIVPNPWYGTDGDGSSKLSLPSWAFVGAAGGVGKTTLAMLTTELLAQTGASVLYVDIDIETSYATSEWCKRTGARVGPHRTFADHVAAVSAAGSHGRHEVIDDAIDVTPEYLREHRKGSIYLVPARREHDDVFAFELVADIKDRSVATCRGVIDGAMARAAQVGAECVVFDCGAQFDHLVVATLHAAHHPFVVAGPVEQHRLNRDRLLRICKDEVDGFETNSVETVVNRVPSEAALRQGWGYQSVATLPFNERLFLDWAEGFPRFELGYDFITERWCAVLADAETRTCSGKHLRLIPTDWDRIKNWALWIADNPEWVDSTGRAVRRRARHVLAWALVLVLVLVLLVADIVADVTPLPGGLRAGMALVTVVAVALVLRYWQTLRRRAALMAELVGQHDVPSLRRYLEISGPAARGQGFGREDPLAARRWLVYETARARGRDISRFWLPSDDGGARP